MSFWLFVSGAARKDLAVHVSLSSIQFSNSPERKPPSGRSGRLPLLGDLEVSSHPTTICNRQLVGCLITHRNEELLEAKLRAKTNRPWRRRLDGLLIGPARRACQRQSQEIVARPRKPVSPLNNGHFEHRAALEPQCSVVLIERFCFVSRVATALPASIANQTDQTPHDPAPFATTSCKNARWPAEKCRSIRRRPQLDEQRTDGRSSDQRKCNRVLSSR